MKRFRRRFWFLFLLAWSQRATRQLLRVAWLGVGGYLLAWGLQQLGGWLPEPRSWLYLGVALALIPLPAIFLPWPRPSRLAWRLDQAYGSQAQLTTAWQVSRAPAAGEIPQLLVGEAAALLPRVTWRVLWRGWYLRGDLVASLIVAVLYVLAFGTNWTTTPLTMAATAKQTLPPLGQDPEASLVFPDGIPGATAANAATTGTSAPRGETAQAISETTQAALQQLGAALSQTAVSHNAGRALQQNDLEGAARELELLADQVDQLARETRDRLADAFAEAAAQIGEESAPAEQALGEDLQQLGDQLRRSGDRTAREQLDQVASDLRALVQLSALAEGGGEAGAGAPVSAGGSPEEGDPQSFARLQGEGETLQLEGAREEGDEGSGLLLAGGQDQAGRDVAAGAADREALDWGNTGSGILTPYDFPWIWRHVVSQYFSPH